MRLELGTSEGVPEEQWSPQKQLSASLAATSVADLEKKLKEAYENFPQETCDLSEWVDLLNAFDSILEECQTLDEDEKKTIEVACLRTHPKTLVEQVLRFTGKILSTSRKRAIYSSAEHLPYFISMNNPEVLLEALRLLAQLTESDETRSLVAHDSALNQKLYALSKGWGGKQDGLGLLFCSSPSDVEEKANVGTTLHFEFHLGSLENGGEGRRIIHISELHRYPESPRAIVEQLVSEFKVPSHLHESLLQRVHLAKSFLDLEERRSVIRVNVLAFTVMARLCAEQELMSNFFIYEPEFIGELMDLVRSGTSVPEDIRVLSIDALRALCFDGIRLPKVLAAAGCSQHHGDVPTLVRKSVAALTGSVDHPIYTGTFIKAIWKFIRNLLTTGTGASSLSSSGVMASLLPLLKDENPEHQTILLSTLRVLDSFFFALETNSMEVFRDLGGVKLLTQRFILEITAIQKTTTLVHQSEGKGKGKERTDTTTDTVIDVPLGKENLLSALLGIIVRIIRNGRARATETSELIEGGFPSALCYILRNHEIFGRSFSLGITVLTAMINSSPTSYVSLQEAGLPSALLTAITDGIKPKDERQYYGILSALPQALRALCLNTAGLAAVQEGKIIPILFSMFVSAEHRDIFKGDLEPASLLGSGLNELLRHHPSLRPAGIQSAIDLLKFICQIGGMSKEDLEEQYKAAPEPEIEEPRSRYGASSYYSGFGGRRRGLRRMFTSGSSRTEVATPAVPPAPVAASSFPTLPSAATSSDTTAPATSDTTSTDITPGEIVSVELTAASVDTTVAEEEEEEEEEQQQQQEEEKEKEGEKEEEKTQDDYFSTIEIPDASSDFFAEMVTNVSKLLEALFSHRQLTSDFIRKKGIWLLLKLFNLPRNPINFSASRTAKSLSLACRSMSNSHPSVLLKHVLASLNIEFEKLAKITNDSWQKGKGFFERKKNKDVIKVLGTIDSLTSLLAGLVRDPSDIAASPFATLLEWTTDNGINVCRSLGQLQRCLLWDVAEIGYKERQQTILASLKKAPCENEAEGPSCAASVEETADGSEPMETDEAEPMDTDGEGASTEETAGIELQPEEIKQPIMHLVSGIHALSSGLVKALALPGGRDGNDGVIAAILDTVANTLSEHVTWEPALKQGDIQPVVKATYLSSVVGELRSLLFDQRYNSTHTLLLHSLMRTEGIKEILNGMGVLTAQYADLLSSRPSTMKRMEEEGEEEKNQKKGKEKTAESPMDTEGDAEDAKNPETKQSEALYNLDVDLVQGALVSFGRFINCVTSSQMLLASPITANMLTQTLPGETGPFDPHVFVASVQALALPTILECWNHEQLHQFPSKFIKSLLLTVGQVLESEKQKKPAKVEETVNQEVVDNLVNNMGFHRPYVEQVLREVGSTNVERAIDRLLTMPPPPPEELISADDEDAELAAALALSMGEAPSGAKEPDTGAEEEDPKELYDQLKMSLFDRCLALMGTVKNFSLPVAETLLSTAKKTGDEDQSPILVGLIEHIKKAASKESLEETLLFQLFHVLTILMEDNTNTCVVVINSGLVEILVKLLEKEAANSTTEPKTPPPKWLASTFLCLDALCKMPKSMEDVPTIVSLHSARTVSEKSKEKADTSPASSDPDDPRNITVDVPTYLCHDERDQCIGVCVRMLERKLDTSSAQALLQLIHSLTREFPTAHRFVQLGGMANLLTLDTAGAFNDQLVLFSMIIQRLIEEPAMLQSAMEAELKTFVNQEAVRGGRVRPSVLLGTFATLLHRSPSLFMKAAVNTCRLKDPDPTIPTSNITIVGATDTSQGVKPESNKKNFASVVRVVGALVDALALLPALTKARADLQKTGDDKSPKKEEEEEEEGEMDTSTLSEKTKEKKKQKEGEEGGEQQSLDSMELPTFSICAVDILRMLTQFVTTYPPCGRIILRKDVKPGRIFVPGGAKDSQKGKEKATPKNGAVNVIRHVMSELSAYQLDGDGYEIADAAAKLLTVLARRPDGRTIILKEIIAAIAKKQEETASRDSLYHKEMQTMVGLLHHLLSSSTSIRQNSVAEIALENGVIDTLVKTLHTVELTNPEAPELLSVLLKTLVLITKPGMKKSDASNKKEGVSSSAEPAAEAAEAAGASAEATATATDMGTQDDATSASVVIDFGRTDSTEDIMEAHSELVERAAEAADAIRNVIDSLTTAGIAPAHSDESILSDGTGSESLEEDSDDIELFEDDFAEEILNWRIETGEPELIEEPPRRGRGRSWLDPPESELFSDFRRVAARRRGEARQSNLMFRPVPMHPLLATGGRATRESGRDMRHRFSVLANRLARDRLGDRRRDQNQSPAVEFARSFQDMLIDALRRVTAFELEQKLKREQEEKERAELERIAKEKEATEKAKAESLAEAVKEATADSVASVEAASAGEEPSTAAAATMDADATMGEAEDTTEATSNTVSEATMPTEESPALGVAGSAVPEATAAAAEATPVETTSPGAALATESETLGNSEAEESTTTTTEAATTPAEGTDGSGATPPTEGGITTTESTATEDTAAEGGESHGDTATATEPEVPELDPAFLAALPEDLRAEAIAQHEQQVRAARLRASTAAATAEGASSTTSDAAAPSPSTIDPEFLAALPADLANQVLADEERRAREAATAAAASSAPAEPSHMTPADFFASLDPATLSAVLSDADEATLSMLPPHLAVERTSYRRRRPFGGLHLDPPPFGVPGRRRRSSRGADDLEAVLAKTSAPPEPEEDQDPLVLWDDVVMLVRLLYLAKPLGKSLLHRLFYNLSAHPDTRKQLLEIMMTILGAASDTRKTLKVPGTEGTSESSSGVYASFKQAVENMQPFPSSANFSPAESPCHPLISDGSIHTGYSGAAERPPSLVSRRVLEIMAHLARKNLKVADFMLGRLPASATKQAKGKLETVDAQSYDTVTKSDILELSGPEELCPLAQMLLLLGVDQFRNTSAQLAQLLQVLAFSVKPIQVLRDQEKARAEAKRKAQKEAEEKAKKEAEERERAAAEDAGATSPAPEGEAEAEEEATPMETDSGGGGTGATPIESGSGGEASSTPPTAIAPVEEPEVSSVAGAPPVTEGSVEEGRVTPATTTDDDKVKEGEEETTEEKEKAKEEKEEEEEEIVLAEDICPVIPLENLKYLAQVLTLDYCTPATYADAEAVLGLLSVRPENRELLFAELLDAAQTVSEVVRQNLENLHSQLEKSTNPTLLFSMASTSDELNLQRIINTILNLPSTESQEAHEVIASLKLDSLWEALEMCLGIIAPEQEPAAGEDSGKGKEPEEREEQDTSTAANLLLPIIEVFFLVNTRDMPREDMSRSRSLTSLSTLSKLSRSNLKKSLSRSGSFYNLSGLQSRFVEFVEKNHKLLNTLVRQNPALLSGSFNILTNYPKSLDFENKMKYFRTKLSELSDEGYYGGCRIKVRRSHVFEDSFSQLNAIPAERLLGRLNVQFRGEEGVDAGGLTRDWFDILAKEMFNANYALFSSTAIDNSTFQPNPHSHINPDHLAYFRFVGRIIARAIYGNIYLPCHFTRSFYKHILGAPLAPQDMEAIDPDYYKSLAWMMNNDITDVLEMNFTTEVDTFGEIKTVELMPEGKNVPVTEENKLEYIQLVTELKMTTSIEKQLKAFLEGFHDIIPKDLIAIFNEMELELLISGLPEVDVEDLREHTDYRGYKSSDKVIQDFWEVLRSFSQEDRAKFLQFVTGTSRVPIGGFGGLKGLRGPQHFQIHKEYNKDRLPSAHTCFNQLDLPEYDDIETLRTNLLYSIRETEGFGFG